MVPSALPALHFSKAPHNKLNVNTPPAAATTKEERQLPGYECTRGWYQVTVNYLHECFSRGGRRYLRLEEDANIRYPRPTTICHRSLSRSQLGRRASVKSPFPLSQSAVIGNKNTRKGQRPWRMLKEVSLKSNVQ